MDGSFIKVVVTVIFISVIACGVISFWALLKSMSRRAMVANVAVLGRAPFAKMPDTKTVETLRMLHVGGVSDDFSIRWGVGDG